MTSASWSMMLVVTVNAILFHAMPRVSRPDILFAVTVPRRLRSRAIHSSPATGRSSGAVRRQRSRSVCCFPRLSPAPNGERG